MDNVTFALSMYRLYNSIAALWKKKYEALKEKTSKKNKD